MSFEFGRIRSGINSFFPSSDNQDLLLLMPQSLGMESQMMKGKPEADLKLYLETSEGVSAKMQH